MSRSWRELLQEDHEVTERALAAVELAFAQPEAPATALVGRLLDYLVYADQCHNVKEEKHLFPLVEKRGIPRHGGPLAVMLSEHDRSRELLSRLRPLGERYVKGEAAALPELREVFAEYASLLKAHYWKENDILYPMSLKVMAPADGEAVVKGIEEVEASFGPDTRARYYRLAQEIVDAARLPDLAHGLDRDVLAAILNTLPVEISFVDADDRVRYFSHEHGEKIFARTRGAIGTPVTECHPQKSVDKVVEILEAFKSGKRSVAEFWIDLGPRKVHIRYFPVRSPEGRYLGTMEVVQDIAPLQKLTGQRTLLNE